MGFNWAVLIGEVDTTAPLFQVVSRGSVNTKMTPMSKFSHCHVSNGLMWCQFPNGKWAKPWTVSGEVKEGESKTTTSLAEVVVLQAIQES